MTGRSPLLLKTCLPNTRRRRFVGNGCDSHVVKFLSRAGEVETVKLYAIGMMWM